MIGGGGLGEPHLSRSLMIARVGGRAICAPVGDAGSCRYVCS